MKTKTLKALLVMVMFFAIGLMKAQTVYVTESGKKYHAKNCSVVKTGKKGMELAEAKKQGYEPCKVCKADDAKASAPADKPKETTKEQPKDKPKDKTKK